MSDGPDAGALPAASQRRRVGHGAVVFAVGPPGSRTAAEAKIRVPRIAVRPAAGPWGERDDFFGGGQAWVGEGGCLGGRRGRLFRRRRDEEGSGRLRFGAAVCPGGGSDDGPRPGQPSPRRKPGGGPQVDAAGNAAIAVSASAGRSAGQRRTAGRRGVVRCRARRVSRGIRSWSPGHDTCCRARRGGARSIVLVSQLAQNKTAAPRKCRGFETAGALQGDGLKTSRTLSLAILRAPAKRRPAWRPRNAAQTPG